MTRGERQRWRSPSGVDVIYWAAQKETVGGRVDTFWCCAFEKPPAAPVHATFRAPRTTVEAHGHSFTLEVSAGTLRIQEA